MDLDGRPRRWRDARPMCTPSPFLFPFQNWQALVEDDARQRGHPNPGRPEGDGGGGGDLEDEPRDLGSGQFQPFYHNLGGEGKLASSASNELKRA